MARNPGGARTAPQDEHYEHFDMQALVRLGMWGGGAVLALIIAVVAARSDIGIRRLGHAYASITTPPGAARERVTPVTVTRPLIADPEGRRLIETVGVLTAERNRLLTRLGTLERNLEDMTGSIKRQTSAARTPEAPAKSPDHPVVGPSVINTISASAQTSMAANANPLTGPASGSRVANAHAVARGETPPAESTATRTEFGVDIGGASSMQKLRAIWLAERTANAKLLRDLQPLVATREGSKPGTVELRLIVGPFANATAAIRLCAHLASERLRCAPSAFNGQKLSLR